MQSVSAALINLLMHKSMESTQKDLIIHLIIQDLLYHRMIYGVQKHEVHIEFYPDLATAVLLLMGYAVDEQEGCEDRHHHLKTIEVRISRASINLHNITCHC